MRRIFLIAMIILVLGLLGGGVWLLLNYNSAPKVLTRANIALNNGLYGEAIEQAETYIGQRPEDFQGHFIKGRAGNRLGRYGEAREALLKARELAPDDIDIQLEMAVGYSLEAHPVTLLQTRAPTAAQYVATMGLLRRADGVLRDIAPQTEDDRLAVQQALGLNLAEMSRTGSALAVLLEREAETLSTVPEAAAGKRAEASQVAAESAATAEQARALLLEVLRKDSQRATAASRLVELCLDFGDESLLAEVRQLVLNQESPPPLAAALLMRTDLQQAFGQRDDEARRKRIAEIAERLEQVIDQHPNHVHIRLARAEAAILQDDWNLAGDMVQAVLRRDASQNEARMLWGQVLLQKQDYVEAERVLRSLSTESRHYAPVHYFYGLAARGAGFEELAMGAMRTAIEIQPDYLEPRIYVIDRLLDGNRPEQAFSEAEQAYRLHPGRPHAVQAYVRAAVNYDRKKDAREALQRLGAHEHLTSEMLRVMAYGYNLLGDERGNVEALQALAASDPTSLNGQMARALALNLEGRTDEAIVALQEARMQYPGESEPRTYLARIHAGKGHLMQAAEMLREVLAINGEDLESRLMLARLYFQNGMLNECRGECDQILRRAPNNVEATILANQVRIIHGEPIDITALQTGPAEGRMGIALAQAYLVADQSEKAIEVCLAELEKSPDDAQARQLLAMAYQQINDLPKCIEQWTLLLQANPADISRYMQLLLAHAQGNSLEKAEELLSATAGAKGHLVSLTLGWYHGRRGQHDQAIKHYTAAIHDRSTGEELADRARLWRARSLAVSGDYDRALVDLRSLSQKPLWQKSASFARAQIMLAARRTAEAETILMELTEQALKENDRPLLRNMVEFRAQLGQTEQALALCDRMEPTSGSDISVLLLKGAVLSLAGRIDEAIVLHERARDSQPGNQHVRHLLALSLDISGRPAEALECLRQMQELGDTASAVATLEMGRLYSRRGLQKAAIAKFEELAAAGHQDPQLQLAIGQALGVLDQKAQAREQLSSIPLHSRQYLEAQLLTAELTDGLEEKIAILDGLDRQRPGQPRVLAQQVVALFEADRADEAVTRLRAWLSVDGRISPHEVARLVVQRLVERGRSGEAAELAVELHTRTTMAEWRRLSACLLADVDMERAAKFLPEVNQADVLDCMLGLWLEGRDAAKASAWAGRLAAIQAPLSRFTIHDQMLVALVSGDRERAERIVALSDQVAMVTEPLSELLAHTAAHGPGEAADLLGSRLARLMYLQPLDASRALAVLKNRRQSLLAAEIVAAGTTDAALVRQAYDMVQPSGSMVARRLEAFLLESDGQVEQAAALLDRLAEENGNHALLRYQQGKTLEQGGRPQDAVTIYQQVAAQDSSIIQAANDAAYLISLFHAEDAARLSEARALIDGAIATSQRLQAQQGGRRQVRVEPALLDTRGWIACLQGDGETALRDLRQAIKGLPHDAQVHAHLAMAESKWGDADLARLHVQAALDMAALGEPPAEADVVEGHAMRLARETLVRLEAPRQ